MRGDRNEARRRYLDQKNANQYTNYTVRQPMPLLEFLMSDDGGHHTRTRAKQLLQRRTVFIDKVITSQFDTPLQPGQLVQVNHKFNMYEFRSRYVKIIYEDAFLLVVEKGEGILTSSVPGARENSVKQILDEYVRRGKKRITVHTVHRLDRATSGLLVFAKRRDVQQTFTDNWQDIVRDRRYVAVVEGEMNEPGGTVQSWLSENRMFRTWSSPTDNGGKLAITHWRKLQQGNDRTLVELKLETGRKNQIRVHMQDLGHPVCGDMKYGAQTDPAHRVCLHAFCLNFIHPVTRELMEFSTPIPEAFNRLFK